MSPLPVFDLTVIAAHSLLQTPKMQKAKKEEEEKKKARRESQTTAEE